MLRKKLLTRLGLLVVMFVVGAVVSIALLQGVLRDLNAMKTDAVIDRVQALRVDLEKFEAEAAAARQNAGGDTASFEASRESVRRSMTLLGEEDAMKAVEGEGAVGYRRIASLLESFLAVGSSPTPSPSPSPEFVAGSAALHGELTNLTAIAFRHISAEQSSLSRLLRSLIIGLTIAALLSTNVAIFVLVRTANMILRPVGQLIEGSRELAQEHYGYRVQVTQHDEFEELARAFNSLAEELSANEQRKVSALQHLAVTLNHEFNNVINAIELRLALLDRRSGGDPQLAAHLDDIHKSLKRMTQTIASLQHVRRVALTSYMPGQLMLDLPRCIAPDEQVTPETPAPVGVTTR